VTPVRVLPLALVAFALLPGSVAAQNDEPNVELGKVESFGPRGRVFATEGTRELVLMTRQSYVAEHGAGFAGAFRVIEGGTQRVYRYETVCASERKGYRLVRATQEGAKEQDEAYSASIDEAIKAPKPAEKAVYNLYFAACRKQFMRFK
jgi:hypothetical protein